MYLYHLTETPRQTKYKDLEFKITRVWELKTETAPNPSLLRPTPLYFFISPLGPRNEVVSNNISNNNNNNNNNNNDSNMILASRFTLRGLMTHISIYCGFCFGLQDLPSDARAFSLTSFEAKSFLVRLTKASNFLQGIF